MFEHCYMNRSATVQQLQQRITEMQSLRLDDRALPTADAARDLLPGRALRSGASYSIHGSTQLARALLSEVSAAGSWCGAIGLPGLGAEAAATLGIALDRWISIPHPGEHAVGIAGTLSEVFTGIILRPTTRVEPREAERLSAKLRENGAVLLVLGDWPRCESTLRVEGSAWSGLGAGHGLLGDRELTISSDDRRGLGRHTVRFSDGRLIAGAPVVPLRAVPPLGVAQ